MLVFAAPAYAQVTTTTPDGTGGYNSFTTGSDGSGTITSTTPDGAGGYSSFSTT